MLQADRYGGSIETTRLSPRSGYWNDAPVRASDSRVEDRYLRRQIGPGSLSLALEVLHAPKGASRELENQSTPLKQLLPRTVVSSEAIGLMDYKQAAQSYRLSAHSLLLAWFRQR